MARLNPNRDTVTTINQDGSRFFLHPSDVRGRFTTWRRWVAWLLIGLFIALPWIPINGHPAVFLDVYARRFHLFGFTLAAQDLWLLFFFVSGLAFLLFYITALFGRLWCGWACPQTVFLEHVFRRVERWIEGDAPARRKLDAAPWTGEKVVKRVLKQGLFVILSAAVAHIFLAYFVSLPTVYGYLTSSPLEHAGTFAFMLIATVVLYFNFAWFREQLCIVICPYGRLQSALIDDDSIIIGYDEKRGEPRGSPKNPDNGDCIDCYRCVQVCPTGIDIRQGLQMECVACSNCIDACDEIMTRLDRPKGLIRYDSLNGLEGKKTRYLRPRVLLYTALLLIGASVAGYAFSGYEPFSTLATRMQGPPYYVRDDVVRNQFMVRIVNKHNDPVAFNLTVQAPADQPLETSGFAEAVTIPPLEEIVQPLVLMVPVADYDGPFTITLTVEDEAIDATVERVIEFLGPDPRLLDRHAGDGG